MDVILIFTFLWVKGFFLWLLSRFFFYLWFNGVVAIGICRKHSYRDIKMSNKANALFLGEILGMEQCFSWGIDPQNQSPTLCYMFPSKVKYVLWICQPKLQPLKWPLPTWQWHLCPICSLTTDISHQTVFLLSVGIPGHVVCCSLSLKSSPEGVLAKMGA